MRACSASWVAVLVASLVVLASSASALNLEHAGIWDYSGQQQLAVQSVAVDAMMLDAVVEVTINSSFLNSQTETMKNAMFVMPLDDTASAFAMSARVGDREVRGVVMKKEEAQAKYDEAVANNQEAYLLSQLKPDVLRLDLGNVEPNVKVLICVKYITQAKRQGDGVQFLLPTTVMPRYTPAWSPSLPIAGNSVLSSGPFSLSLVVQMETAITNITSTTHAIKWTGGHRSMHSRVLDRVELADTEFKMNGDIVILVSFDSPHEPRVLVEAGPNGTHAAMVTLFPSFALTDVKPEIIFVIDRSGSMQGSSIKMARESLQLLLRSLPMDCYFNIISFGSHFEPLFPSSVWYSQETLNQATSYVQRISAMMGGTEILRPLVHIATIMPQIPNYARQVIVITDGQVSNTQEVISHVHRESETNGVRYFAVGIGGGVSHHLVNGIARAGQGTAAFTVEGERMQGKLIEMLKNALQPRLTSVRVDYLYNGEVDLPSTPIFSLPSFFSTSSDKKDADAAAAAATTKALVQQAPAIIPPVYSQSLFTIHAIFPQEATFPTGVMISAVSPDGPMKVVLPVRIEEATHGLVLHRMAARILIQDLEEGRAILRGGESTAESVASKIVQLGVTYSMLSKHTSFVAIGEEVKQTAPPKRKLEEGGAVRDSARIMYGQAYARASPQTHRTAGAVASPAVANPSITVVGASFGGRTMAKEASERVEYEASLSPGSSDTEIKSLLRGGVSGAIPISSMAHSQQIEGDDPASAAGGGGGGGAGAGGGGGAGTGSSVSFADLIKLQAHDGSFGPASLLANELKVIRESIIDNNPLRSESAWITAHAVVVLRVRFADLASEWQLAEAKAMAFIETALKNEGRNDISAEKLVEMAKSVQGTWGGAAKP